MVSNEFLTTGKASRTAYPTTGKSSAPR